MDFHADFSVDFTDFDAGFGADFSMDFNVDCSVDIDTDFMDFLICHKLRFRLITKSFILNERPKDYFA